MRANALLDQGNLDGQAVWIRILKAIKEMLAKEPPDGQALH